MKTYNDWIDAFYDESKSPFIYNNKTYILNWDSINSALDNFGQESSLKDIGDKTDYLIEVA